MLQRVCLKSLFFIFSSKMSVSNEDIVQAIKGYQERLERYVSQNNYEKVNFTQFYLYCNENDF